MMIEQLNSLMKALESGSYGSIINTTHIAELHSLLLNQFWSQTGNNVRLQLKDQLGVEPGDQLIHQLKGGLND